MTDHSVRDLLPELAAGRLDDEAARRVEAHVEDCPECAAELDVLWALDGARPVVPAGLEDRVRAAVHEEMRQAAAPVIRLEPRRRSWIWSPWVAAAAAAVVAVLGGTLVLGGGDEPLPAETEILALETEAPYGSLPGTSGDLAGVAMLDDLSEEELEQLLVELEL